MLRKTICTLLAIFFFNLCICLHVVSFHRSINSIKTKTYSKFRSFQRFAVMSEKSHPRVVWKAAATSSVAVKETKRTCEDYMALPPTEYSVLAQDQIERLSENEFKCNLPGLNFFGYKVQPIVYATVTVFPEESKSVINVTKAELKSNSPLVDKINNAFSITAVNTVFVTKDVEGFKYLNSNTSLVIDTAVPSTVVPLSVVRSGGNLIIQASLKIAVVTFIRILSADFRRWSAGSNERNALEGAKLELE